MKILLILYNTSEFYISIFEFFSLVYLIHFFVWCERQNHSPLDSHTTPKAVLKGNNMFATEILFIALHCSHRKAQFNNT